MATVLACYPVCMTDSTGIVSFGAGTTSISCPSDTESGICSIVAATNINSLHVEWSCDTDGYPASNPCASGNTWTGLQCSSPSLGPQALNFASMGIMGTIPSQLAFLSTLESLSLNGNSFTGSLPSGLARLSKLTTLYVDSNSLTGKLRSVLLLYPSTCALHMLLTDLCTFV
jgi:Leucine-rich repeat (LRR) protein